MVRVLKNVWNTFTFVIKISTKYTKKYQTEIENDEILNL